MWEQESRIYEVLLILSNTCRPVRLCFDCKQFKLTGLFTNTSRCPDEPTSPHFPPTFLCLLCFLSSVFTVSRGEKTSMEHLPHGFFSSWLGLTLTQILLSASGDSFCGVRTGTGLQSHCYWSSRTLSQTLEEMLHIFPLLPTNSCLSTHKTYKTNQCIWDSDQLLENIKSMELNSNHYAEYYYS